MAGFVISCCTCHHLLLSYTHVCLSIGCDKVLSGRGGKKSNGKLCPEEGVTKTLTVQITISPDNFLNVWWGQMHSAF